MTIVLLGPPGAGKGTQSRRLADRFGIPQVATGDLLRAAREEGSPLGTKAERYMTQGTLVPDDVVIGLIRERLAKKDCHKGVILDGFPRTIGQAEALEASLTRGGSRIDRVVNLEVESSEVVERLSGRRQCRACGENYHLRFHPSSREKVCDRCGGELLQRDDDREDVIRRRLDVYKKQTAPLVTYYEQRGLLARVSGSGAVEEVFGRIIQAVT